MTKAEFGIPAGNAIPVSNPLAEINLPVAGLFVPISAELFDLSKILFKVPLVNAVVEYTYTSEPFTQLVQFGFLI